MKKIKHSILALFLCFVFLLTSCGGANKSQNNQSTPNSSAQTNQSVMQNGGANNTATTCQNGHKIVTDEAVAPTCTEAGLTKGSHCSVCNEVIIKQETIKPNGHSMVADDKIDATCTQSGLTSGAHCVVCNEIMIAQKEIPQLEHSYSAWNVREQASCKEFGIEYRVCSVCNKEETKSIAILPHATAIWVTEDEATCTESGIKAKKCSACLTTLETQTISAKGHSWNDATCTAPETCSSCQVTRGSALEHNWIEETCVTPQICIGCGKTENKLKAHSFSDYKCTLCGTTNIITVSKYDDEEIFYAFADSQLKINFSNFKADSLQIKEDDNTVYSASMTDVITLSLPKGAYVVRLTYYNSYETVQQLMRNPDGSYGYQYVTKGAGTEYSLVFGLVISDSNADFTYHSWYVKYYTPATCEDEGSAIVACHTCSSISEIIIPLSHIDINTDHGCDECGIYMHNYVNNTCTACGLYRNSKTVKFGSYPQTKVTDSSLTSTLTTMAGTLPTSSNSQAWTSYGYYIKGKVKNFMWYIDVEQGGEKYRGVYFTSYRPSYTTALASSTDHTYQDDNGYTISTVYWFKYEPISWTILSEDTANGTALILCDMIIDSQEYYINASDTRTIDGKTVYCNNYAESTIRKWLNDTFYNTAFNELQKQIILTTTVDNSAAMTGSSTNKYACENTEDNIFLLSYKDVKNSNYGFSSNSYDTARQKKTTDYAQAQGARTYSEEYYGGNGCWWLRSPGYDFSNDADNVYGDGVFTNSDNVYYTYFGVVPALQIIL